MNLSNLKSSFSELNDAEKLNLILKIRESRRTPKKLPKQASPKSQKQPKEEPSMDKLIASMSPEALSKLISQLKENKK